MTRASILAQLIVRHTLGSCLAGALLGTLYTFLVFVFAPLQLAVTYPVPDFDLGQFMFATLAVTSMGLIVGIIGGLVGALLGVAAGLVNGLLLGLFTILICYPPAEYRYYRPATGLISVAATVAVTYFLTVYAFPGILNAVFTPDRDTFSWWLLLSPTAIAGLGAWWLSRLVARWYQHELPEVLAEMASPPSPGLL